MPPHPGALLPSTTAMGALPPERTTMKLLHALEIIGIVLGSFALGYIFFCMYYFA